MNFAARMETNSAPNRLQVTPAVVARIGASTRVRVVESRLLTVKGKGDVTCSFVDSVAPGRGRHTGVVFARRNSFLDADARAVRLLAHSLMADASDGFPTSSGIDGPQDVGSSTFGSGAFRGLSVKPRSLTQETSFPVSGDASRQRFRSLDINSAKGGFRPRKSASMRNFKERLDNANQFLGAHHFGADLGYGRQSGGIPPPGRVDFLGVKLPGRVDSGGIPPFGRVDSGGIPPPGRVDSGGIPLGRVDSGGVRLPGHVIGPASSASRNAGSTSGARAVTSVMHEVISISGAFGPARSGASDREVSAIFNRVTRTSGVHMGAASILRTSKSAAFSASNVHWAESVRRSSLSTPAVRAAVKRTGPGGSTSGVHAVVTVPKTPKQRSLPRGRRPSVVSRAILNQAMATARRGSLTFTSDPEAAVSLSRMASSFISKSGSSFKVTSD